MVLRAKLNTKFPLLTPGAWAPPAREAHRTREARGLGSPARAGAALLGCTWGARLRAALGLHLPGAGSLGSVSAVPPACGSRGNTSGIGSARPGCTAETWVGECPRAGPASVLWPRGGRTRVGPRHVLGPRALQAALGVGAHGPHPTCWLLRAPRGRPRPSPPRTRAGHRPSLLREQPRPRPGSRPVPARRLAGHPSHRGAGPPAALFLPELRALPFPQPRAGRGAAEAAERGLAPRLCLPGASRSHRSPAPAARCRSRFVSRRGGRGAGREPGTQP